MKKISIIIFILILAHAKSQIGINTPNPRANLEVHKSNLPNIPDGIIPPRVSADSLQLKDHLYGPAQNGALIYITKPSSKNMGKTKQMTSQGYYVYNAESGNKDGTKGVWKKMVSDPNAFATNGSTPVTFSKTEKASAALDFQAINLSENFGADIGSEYISDNQYIVPETGLYVINFNINILKINNYISTSPAIAILKTSDDNTVRSFLTNKRMDGITTIPDGKSNLISVAPQTSVNHIYQLKQGEKISFGLVVASETIFSLGEISTEISIYKIR